MYSRVMTSFWHNISCKFYEFSCGFNVKCASVLCNLPVYVYKWNNAYLLVLGVLWIFNNISRKFYEFSCGEFYFNYLVERSWFLISQPRKPTYNRNVHYTHVSDSRPHKAFLVFFLFSVNPRLPYFHMDLCLKCLWGIGGSPYSLRAVNPRSYWGHALVYFILTLKFHQMFIVIFKIKKELGYVMHNNKCNLRILTTYV